MNKLCSIIIPAWNCADYVMECYDSVRRQVLTPGWDYKIILGVDACEETSAVLIKNKVPHYFSPVNVGHYVMRNSMIGLQLANCYAYFDSDDKMFPDYIRHTLENINRTGVVMCAKINCDVSLKPKHPACIENGGAMSFINRAWQAVGGFCNYRAAADTDFLRRLEMAGFKIYKIPQGLYYRRSHPNALTKCSSTGMGSPYRKQVWAEMCAARERGIIKITPVTVKLEMR
jgi:glycosyltransferase involved in cell wall biosynthesis